MCRTWGSNSGPLACQTNSLPIELPRPVVLCEYTCIQNNKINVSVLDIKGLGHTKLIPWCSDFVFENKERASAIFIFVQKLFSIILWSERMFFFFLIIIINYCKVRIWIYELFFFHSQNIHRLTNVTDVMQTVLCIS